MTHTFSTAGHGLPCRPARDAHRARRPRRRRDGSRRAAEHLAGTARPAQRPARGQGVDGHRPGRRPGHRRVLPARRPGRRPGRLDGGDRGRRGRQQACPRPDTGPRPRRARDRRAARPPGPGSPAVRPAAAWQPGPAAGRRGPQRRPGRPGHHRLPRPRLLRGGPEPGGEDGPGVLYAACQRVLRPGGVLAVITAGPAVAPDGQLADLPGRRSPRPRRRPGLRPAHRPGPRRHRRRPASPPPRPAGASACPAACRVHSDLLVFTKPGGPAHDQPPAPRPPRPPAPPRDRPGPAAVGVGRPPSGCPHPAPRPVLPASTAHPAKMLPAIAATAITRYTEPGNLVADPMCGIGTTLVEAVHLGRDGLGVEYEDRWATIAAANIARARRQGAAGNAEVIRGDARLLPGLLPPGTAGRAALVVTSPPYGPSVHGQVWPSSGRPAAGSASTTTATATTPPTSPARAWTSCSPGSPRSWPAARCCCGPAAWPWSPPGPGGSAASWSTCPPPSSPPGPRAGLIPAARCVALLAGLRGGRLIARPSFFQLDNLRRARRQRPALAPDRARGRADLPQPAVSRRSGPPAAARDPAHQPERRPGSRPGRANWPREHRCPRSARQARRRRALTAGSLCTGYGGLDLAVMAVTGARLAWMRRDRPVRRRRPGPPLARGAQPRRHHRPGLGGGAARRPGQRRVAVPGHHLRRPRGRHHGRNPQWPLAHHRRRPSPSSTRYVFLENVAALRTRGPRRKSSATWPRSGMTRNGCAFALPTPEPRTAATASSSSPSGPARPGGSRLLPTPVAGNFNDGEDLPNPGWPAGTGRRNSAVTATGSAPRCPSRSPCCPPRWPATSARTRPPARSRPSGAKRQTGLPDVIIHRLAGQGGHGRAGGSRAEAGCCRPRTPAARRTATAGGEAGPATGTRAARASTSRPRPSPRPAPQPGTSPAAWAEYEPAIRRWEQRPRVPRAAARRAGAVRPAPAVGRVRRVDDGHAPKLVTGVPGIPRTRQLKIIGNGVVPQQAALALRLLIGPPPSRARRPPIAARGPPREPAPSARQRARAGASGRCRCPAGTGAARRPRAGRTAARRPAPATHEKGAGAGRRPPSCPEAGAHPMAAPGWAATGNPGTADPAAAIRSTAGGRRRPRRARPVRSARPSRR